MKDKIDYDEYLNRLKNKTMTFLDVRKDMEIKGYKDDEISQLIRVLDNDMIKSVVIKENNKSAYNMVWAGLVTTLILLIVNYLSWSTSYRTVVFLVTGITVSTLFVGLAKIRKS